MTSASAILAGWRAGSISGCAVLSSELYCCCTHQQLEVVLLSKQCQLQRRRHLHTRQQQKTYMVTIRTRSLHLWHSPESSCCSCACWAALQGLAPNHALEMLLGPLLLLPKQLLVLFLYHSWQLALTSPGFHDCPISMNFQSKSSQMRARRSRCGCRHAAKDRQISSSATIERSMLCC